MILKSARASCGRWTSSSIALPRSLWCRFTKSAGHRSHNCSGDSTSSPQSADGILRDSNQMLPASMGRVMTTVNASAFSPGKRCFHLFNRERRVYLHQPLVLDEKGATGTAVENSPCSWFEYVVGLSLCSTQFSLLDS